MNHHFCLTLKALLSFITLSAVCHTQLLADSAFYSGNFQDGHHVKMLYNGEDLTKERMLLAQKAQRSIYISTFIMSAQKSELPFYNLLCARAKEGIDIRIILDFRGSFSEEKNIAKFSDSTDMTSVKAFQRCGIKFEYYNATNLPKALFAKHDKLLLIDGEAVLMGGSNFATDYTTHGVTQKTWYDMDATITGPVACHFHREFERMWHELMKDQSRLYPSGKHWELYQRFDPLGLTGCHETKAPAGKSKILGVYNNPRDAFFRPIFDTYAVAIEKMIEQQDKSPIYLYAPYFTPDEEMIDLLVYARSYGIPVFIITSARESNHGASSIAVTGMLQNVKPLLDAGVQIHLWSPVKAKTPGWPHKDSNVFHRKGGSIGNEFFFLGSDNLDTRGHHQSAESVAFIQDQQLNDEFRKNFQSDLRYTIKLTNTLRKELLKKEEWYRRAGAIIGRNQL